MTGDGAPSSRLSCDVCVIGAGAGGLSVAAGAAQMGARVVLVERGAMGGDCLNAGCVPSKALLAAARRVRQAGGAVEAATVSATVWAQVAAAQAAIAPNDSQARFESLGVTVTRAAAVFIGRDRLRAGDSEITARAFVIATGSHPVVPAIPGLADVPYLTNETLFAPANRGPFPPSMLIIGGGPVGVEMAQAHARLGVTVTVVDSRRLLPRDDEELVAVVRDRLIAEGVTVIEGQGVTSLAPAGTGGITATLADGRVIKAARLLLATGRRPNVDGLGLEAAGVTVAATGGIVVDRRLRTANRRIFAIGDVTGEAAFTHAAAQQAGVVIRNALFRWPYRYRDQALPWVTFTEPELAQVGMTEAAARVAGVKGVRVLRWSFADNDRAWVEGETAGLVKLVVDGCGRVLGAGIVGPHAGEQIGLWCLAVAKRLEVADIAGLMLPYPTYGEAGKRAAGSFFTAALFSPRVRRLVRWLARLPPLLL